MSIVWLKILDRLALIRLCKTTVLERLTDLRVITGSQCSISSLASKISRILMPLLPVCISQSKTTQLTIQKRVTFHCIKLTNGKEINLSNPKERTLWERQPRFQWMTMTRSFTSTTFRVSPFTLTPLIPTGLSLITDLKKTKSGRLN